MTHQEAESARATPLPALDDLVSEVAELTTLPTVAMQVAELAGDDQFSSDQLSRTISGEPALTAKLIRLANSAYYGYSREIATVRDAVVLLGFRAVRSAALASCVIDMLPHRATTLDPSRFWRFSVTVAALAEILAQAEHRHVEEAFTAGVLHNIGRLALDQHRPRDLMTTIRFAEQEDISIADAEREVLGFTDAELGAALAERWNFPDQLVDTVARHQLSPADVDDRDSLAAIVVRARAFAHTCGLSDGIERTVDSVEDASWLLPPLSQALETHGGIDGVEERASHFIGSMFGNEHARAA